MPEVANARERRTLARVQVPMCAYASDARLLAYACAHTRLCVRTHTCTHAHLCALVRVLAHVIHARCALSLSHLKGGLFDADLPSCIIPFGSRFKGLISQI